MMTPLGRQRKLSTEVFNSPELRAVLETARVHHTGPNDTTNTNSFRAETRRTVTPRRRLTTLDNVDSMIGVQLIGKTLGGGKLLGPIDRFKGRTRTASLSSNIPTELIGTRRKRSRTLSSGNTQEMKIGSRCSKGLSKGVQMTITDLMEAQSGIEGNAKILEVELLHQ